jgi:segregation and condensation protein B
MRHRGQNLGQGSVVSEVQDRASEQSLLLIEADFGSLQLLESLLFVATEPVSVADLAHALGLTLDETEVMLVELAQGYQNRGIRLQRHGDRVQLVSAPEAAATIEKFLGLQSSTRLSNAALETLAVIAYKQPITRAAIEAVRGVDCSGAIRTLLQRGLIVEAGRMQTAGRPVLYSTTDEFLKQFGLEDIKELPAIEGLGTEDGKLSSNKFDP